MLLEQIKLEFYQVTASKHQRSQKSQTSDNIQKVIRIFNFMGRFQAKSVSTMGFAHSQSKINERANFAVSSLSTFIGF